MAQLGAHSSDDLVKISLDNGRPIEERASACMVLGQMRSRKSISVLLEISKKAEDPLLVWQCLAAVGSIGSRTATRPLMRQIRTATSGFMRQAAVFALGQLIDERARMLLTRVLLDLKEIPKTRGFAAEALGLLRFKKATLTSLVRASEDESPEVRYSVLCGLGALRDKATLPVLERRLNDHAIVDRGTIAEHATLIIDEIRRHI